MRPYQAQDRDGKFPSALRDGLRVPKSTSGGLFNFNKFISTYYTYDGATTNFVRIFASESDMRGIRQLIDTHLAEKPYLDY